MKHTNLSIIMSIIIIVQLFSISTPISVTAYTSCDGIEEGDVALVQYIGTYDPDGDGTPEEFDRHRDNGAEFTIEPGRLIDGFYNGLLGMKVGERKNIIVPPSQGYVNVPPGSPQEKFEGQTLYFDTYIVSIIQGERDCDGANSGDSFGNQIASFFGYVAGILLISFIAIYFYYSLQKQTTPKCEHCSSEGRNDVPSEGKCGKCGQFYCRKSFSRGCPSCTANSFVPN